MLDFESTGRVFDTEWNSFDIFPEILWHRIADHEKFEKVVRTT